jgi:TolA-binding protein
MYRTLVSGCAVIALVAGCGSSQKATETKPAEKSAATGGAASGSGQATQGAQQMAQGLSQLAQGLENMSKNAAKPVDFEELKTLIPDVAGWTKGEVKGEQVSVGISQSSARGKYTKGDATLELEITDSALNQLLLAPLTMMLAPGFEEKSDDGYHKSVQVGGFPGFEEWEKDAKHAQVTAVVANRFIVSANAHDVESADAALKAVEAVNLTKLSGLK